MTNSQYYGQTSTSYQPYNYPSTSTPVSPSMYATPYYAPAALTMYMRPPIPYPTAPPAVIPPAPLPTYAHAPRTPTYPPFTHTLNYQPPYAPPTAISAPTYVAPGIPKYQPTVPSKSTSTPKIASPKCSPPTAIAYYLTPAVKLESPKSVVEEMKDNFREKLPPTYPCPFCTGFQNVPKNSKVPPPPPCATVLPGILDKIPTITMPDKLKIKELSKLAPSSLSDLFEHKLSGKLRFDQDVLDGFLTGLGLGNCND